MRYINFGPVANQDGTPSDITKEMLAGTGRNPEEFVKEVPRTLANDALEIALDMQDGSIEEAMIDIEDYFGSDMSDWIEDNLLTEERTYEREARRFANYDDGIIEEDDH